MKGENLMAAPSCPGTQAMDDLLDIVQDREVATMLDLPVALVRKRRRIIPGIRQ